MYETIKQFLSDGGKCLLIENGKPAGVVLTMEEYKSLQNNQYQQNLELPKKSEKNFDFKLPKEEIKFNNNKESNADAKERIISNPIGEAMIKEMDFPEASAELADINLADDGDVTLEDLGLDPDMQLPKDF